MRLLLSLFLFAGIAAAASAQSIALRGVTVIDGTGAPPLPGRTVLVDDGRIAAIFKDGAQSLPDGANVIDLPGRTLLPGLIDAHVHFTIAARDASPEELARRRETGLAALLAGGITGIRELAGDARISRDLQHRQARGEIAAPAIRFAAVFFGPQFLEDERARASAGDREPGDAPWSRMVTPELDLDAAMAEARSAGATGVKLYASLDPGQLAALSRAARAQGLLVWTHSVVFPSGSVEAVAAGTDSLIHAKGMVTAAGIEGIPADFAAGTRQWMMSRRFADMDPEGPAFQALYAEMRRRGTILEPALMADGDLAPQPLPPQRASMRDWACRATGAAYRAGVAIGVGTDSAGLDPAILRRELARLVECGLNPLDAIRAATQTNARALGLGGTHGTVEAGRAADLLVVGGDPATDLAALGDVRLVIQAGRIVGGSETGAAASGGLERQP
jgi:imidazolonepropionase-like amidohydrolase